MGETTKEDATTKPSPNQTSSPKNSSSVDHQTPLLQHQSFLPSPIFIPTGTISSSAAPVIPKRPRLGSSPPQWKALPSPSTIATGAASPSPSTETAGSSPTNNKKQQEQQHHKFRKGKYVSPVWKPSEMLWLARAWRVQYQQQGTGSTGSGSGEGRGKTRAEKDREVAEFLNRHGVNRDAKIAGTKWDNMLGEFRKVYEWEKGESFGKSYFRLSPYERKQHRLPASFDEQVFQELITFMGPRVRGPSITRGTTGAPASVMVPPPPLESLPPPLTSSRDQVLDTNPIPPLGRGKRLALAIAGYDPYSHNIARGSGLFSNKSPYNPCSETIPSSSSSSSSLKDLRRIGKLRLTWEESVNLWGEEGEVDYGRIRVSGSSFLNADELTYLDDSMVACTMESFEDGPLKGFSLDKFVSGQHLKVFGRQKLTSSSAPSASVNMAGFFDRAQFPSSEPIYRSISTLEFQDPSDHCLSKLRVPAGNLLSLFELSRYLQEPPSEHLRFPLRRDVYKDLPPGKELFFTSSSTELLDCRAITYDIISPIMSNNDVVISSNDSLIPLWDDCINRMVSKFCDEMVILRKPDSSSWVENIQDQWPNVMGYVKGFGLWRGEETDQVREGAPHPSSLLAEKILWSYNDLPYILGYYAIGFTVTFCALSRSSSEDGVICTELYSFDISSPSDRIKALVPCYRLASLIPLLADRCTMGHLCYNDFERINSGEYVTEVTPHTVTKCYSSKRKWTSVKGLYDFLDQRVPHAEHVERSNENKLSLSFKPRGIRIKPRNVDELIESLMCVTRALVALHDLSFMHRDMGWENVMRTSTLTDTEWFICGFDEAAEAPQLNPHRHVAKEVDAEEERERHAPEMERGLHAVKVDVWGVGYMIKTCGLSNVPKMLRELQGKCLEPNQENRPTAADCFHHLLQVQSASTSSY